MSAAAWKHLDFDELDDADMPDVSIDGLIDLLHELGPIPAWARDALCADPTYSHVSFFPERGETTAEAAEVCGRCQYVAECAAWADERGVKSGVWAGVNYGDRSRKAA